MTLLLEPPIVRAGGKPPSEMFEDAPAPPETEADKEEEEEST